MIRVNLSTNISTTFISGLTAATGMAVDASGNLYVANASNQISKYDSSANLIGTAGFITGLNHPYGLSLVGNDLYVVNNGTGTVGEYDITNPTNHANSSIISGLTNAISIDVVPEPSDVALLCISGVAFAAWRIRGMSRRGRRKK
ncbi:MAG: hypothetical protein ABI443_14285 [Chthoniobacterales bacterium]